MKTPESSPEHPEQLSEAEVSLFAKTLVGFLQQEFPQAHALLSRLDCDVQLLLGMYQKIYSDRNPEKVFRALQEQKEAFGRRILEVLEQSIDLGPIPLLGLNRDAEWSDMKMIFRPLDLYRGQFRFYLRLLVDAEGMHGHVHKGSSVWKQDDSRGTK